jgi:hypothetical protein
MRSRFWLLMVVVSLAGTALAAKPHVVSFGKVLPVKLFIGPGEDRTVPMNVRALLVDGRLKEFTTGEPHTVTDRIFVVRRAFRVNDSLPADQGKVPRWVWQRGGWLMVDRTTARITQLNLPFFDPFYSQASWFRDYAAYCGMSDNGEKLYTIVMQLGQVGRKKAVLRQEIGAATQGEDPDSDCAAPTWEKNPARVTFHPKRGQPSSFIVRGHSADVAPGSSEEEE